MKEIGKILKKFTFPIICVIALLWVQATCDLTLPDYTANIINVGIQEKGIDSAIPGVLRKEVYDTILSLATDTKKIEDIYEKKVGKIYQPKNKQNMKKSIPLLKQKNCISKKI